LSINLFQYILIYVKSESPVLNHPNITRNVNWFPSICIHLRNVYFYKVSTYVYKNKVNSLFQCTRYNYLKISDAYTKERTYELIMLAQHNWCTDVRISSVSVLTLSDLEKNSWNLLFFSLLSLSE